MSGFKFNDIGTLKLNVLFHVSVFAPFHIFLGSIKLLRLPCSTSVEGKKNWHMFVTPSLETELQQLQIIYDEVTEIQLMGKVYIKISIRAEHGGSKAYNMNEISVSYDISFLCNTYLP